MWAIQHHPTFDVGLLMSVCYPKRSYIPYSKFLPDLFNGALLIWSLVLIYWISFFYSIKVKLTYKSFRKLLIPLKDTRVTIVRDALFRYTDYFTLLLGFIRASTRYCTLIAWSNLNKNPYSIFFTDFYFKNLKRPHDHDDCEIDSKLFRYLSYFIH